MNIALWIAAILLAAVMLVSALGGVTPTGGWGNDVGALCCRRRLSLVWSSPCLSVTWRPGAPLIAVASAYFRFLLAGLPARRCP